MDDKKGRIQISQTTKLVIAFLAAAILGLSVSLLIFSKELTPGETRSINQFNHHNASMRHIFKVSNLNHRAFDAFLEAYLLKDQGKLSDSLDYLKASIGFIYAGYIDNSELVQKVVPLIRGSIDLISKNELALRANDIGRVKSNFKDTFFELEQIEKDIYISIQKLFDHQQHLQKRWQLFYLLLVSSATFGILAIAFLSFRQRRLIGELEYNQKNLMSEIKERRQAEKEKSRLVSELHQARKMESIGLMAGGVAHDLNNILSGIVGYPELLLGKLDHESELRKPLEAMHDSGIRAAQVVDDLLTVARGVATVKKVLDLNKLVEEYFSSPEFAELQQIYPEVTFSQSLTKEKLPIFCSSVHVKKCLMNLVTNGAEAIVDSGEVKVSTIVAPKDNSGSGTKIILQVDDTGPGISKTDVVHIFDPFYSKKHLGRSGTGLGLTVVWNTMDNHHGSTEVESSEDGTRFTLSFPFSYAEHDDAEQLEVEKLDLGGNGEQVLVIDDEEQLRDLCHQMLTDLGYRVSSVSSGEEALDFLEHTSVDVIVLDMLMPPGMNGRQTYKIINARYPGQKAIIASGFSESEDVKATLKSGASLFIKKPYSKKDIGTALKQTLTAAEQ